MSLYAVEPGYNLSPRVFTSPEIFEHELQQIFPHSWIHVADRSELAAPGAYVAAMIGRTPVLVVRDRASGELRAYLNACRHRGAQLLEGKGTCDKQIKCPYHAWSYGTNGALLGVPYRDQFAHVNFDELDLVPVRVDTVGPFVFACLDPDAPSLAEWTGDLGEALAAVSTWQLGYELTYELAANWKLFIENANDAYHVQFVHDLLTDAILADETRTFTTLEAHGAHTWAQINPAYVPPGHDPELSRVRFGSVFPNFIPVLTPSDLTYIRVDPVAHDRMKLVVRSYEHPEFAELREFRKLAFERTTDQDIAVILRTQRGLHAQGLPAGVHASAFENRIGHFEQLWVQAMKADSGVVDHVISEHSLVRSR